MYNEILFVAHSFLVSGFALLAARIGKYTLVAYVCLLTVLANLLVTKQITLFGWHATASDAYAIGAVLSLNLLQEFYGKALSKRTVWISFAMLVAYTVLTRLHLLYTPSTVDYQSDHFKAILATMPRITAASLFAFLTSQHLDRYLYSLLSEAFGDRYFLVKNWTSVAVCQLIDTLLFSFLGLYGIINNVWSIVVVSYSIKITALIIATPIIACAKNFVKPPVK